LLDRDAIPPTPVRLLRLRKLASFCSNRLQETRRYNYRFIFLFVDYSRCKLDNPASLRAATCPLALWSVEPNHGTIQPSASAATNRAGHRRPWDGQCVIGADESELDDPIDRSVALTRQVF
jgi:hypothetical protein